MDDFIFSSNDQLETENLKNQLIEKLSRCGLKLTKFASNLEELSEKIKEKILVLGWLTD